MRQADSLKGPRRVGGEKLRRGFGHEHRVAVCPCLGRFEVPSPVAVASVKKEVEIVRADLERNLGSKMIRVVVAASFVNADEMRASQHAGCNVLPAHGLLEAPDSSEIDRGCVLPRWFHLGVLTRRVGSAERRQLMGHC